MRNIVRDVLASAYDVNRMFKVLRKILLIVAIPTVIVIVVFTFLGEGYTVEALSANYKSYMALRAMEQTDYKKSAEYIYFYGYDENKDKFSEELALEEKLAFPVGLKAFYKGDGRTLMDYKVLGFRTEKGHTQGVVEVVVKEKSRLYTIGLEIHVVEGLLAPSEWVYVTSDIDEDTSGELVANKLMRVLETYRPEAE